MNDYNLFILSAGKPSNSNGPVSLMKLTKKQSILEWQLSSFKSTFNIKNAIAVVGYDYASVVREYHDLQFKYVPNWENTGPLGSFLEAVKGSSSSALVTYGDTVFHTETLRQISSSSGDVVVAVDSKWQRRFYGRPMRDQKIAETLTIPSLGKVEYTGLIKFSEKSMAWLSEQKNTFNDKSDFPMVIAALKRSNLNIVFVDIHGGWAELNEPNDLVQFVMGNKAETLKRLGERLTKITVCDQITVPYTEWINEPKKVFEKLHDKLPSGSVIVRSCSKEEDAWDTSNAGKFTSILNVELGDNMAVAEAIDAVFSSYNTDLMFAEVLIQPFIQNVLISGVLFTCDISTGAPYFVVNYDDNTGRTDTITSGENIQDRNIMIYRNNTSDMRKIDARLLPLLDAALEIEEVLGYNKLDIEFAIAPNGEIFLFQVRPIAVSHANTNLDEAEFDGILSNAQTQFRSLMCKQPGIIGDYTVFSGMTDWNPAEIIGQRPNILAASLYSYLITEKTWSRQRYEYGYRNVQPSPLVYYFCSQPYVDCRASINSFIPTKIDDKLSKKLVEAYLDILNQDPSLHDKVELDICFTVWTANFVSDAQKRFCDYNLNLADIEKLGSALKEITARALKRLDEDIAPIRELESRREAVFHSDQSSIDKAYYLIEDCLEYGTLAFAHAARAGFVAITILKSLVSRGHLTFARMLEFQSGILTVTSEFLVSLADEKTDVVHKIKEFGHLRPGTYDAAQFAYWEQPEFYFQKPNLGHLESQPNNFTFSEKELIGLQEFLDGLQTNLSTNDLITYMRNAIQAREKTKFEFTKNVSNALDFIIKFCENEVSLSREDACYLTIDDIKNIRVRSYAKDNLKSLIECRRKRLKREHLVQLPTFINSERDFVAFEQPSAAINFITDKCVTANLFFLSSMVEHQTEKNIVALPNADPGYDWIFSTNIAGLITKYGGANSHMAIRCAELGIPAAIGIGDKNYGRLKERPTILDCKSQIVKNV